MALVALRVTPLRAFLLLSLCLSLVFIHRISSLDESSFLDINNLDISKLGEILGQGIDVTQKGPLSSIPAGETPTTLAPNPAQIIEDSDADSLPHLRSLCNSTIWRPNLSLHCHSRCGPDKSSFCGGLNNARDRVQTCIRLAIDAGATTVFIPSIAARSESALWTVDPSAVPEDVGEPVVLCPEAWFSLEQLQKALSNGCHQLRVKFVCSAQNGVVESSETASLRTLDMPWRPLGGHRYDVRPGHTFREAIDEAGLLDSPEGSSSALVEYGDPYIACRSLLAQCLTVAIPKDAWGSFRFLHHFGPAVSQSSTVRFTDSN